ncbi:hypothetical protein, partial [Kaarinaea lacus]
ADNSNDDDIAPFLPGVTLPGLAEQIDTFESSLNSGNADAGVIFYHLALYFTRTFPDKFEIVPLGGTADKPAPVKGNKVAVLKAVRIKGDWNEKQLKAREQLVKALTSDTFGTILNKHGINQP